MKRIAVLTSGEDAPGMNAAARAVVLVKQFLKELKSSALNRDYAAGLKEISSNLMQKA